MAGVRWLRAGSAVVRVGCLAATPSRDGCRFLWSKGCVLAMADDQIQRWDVKRLDELWPRTASMVYRILLSTTRDLDAAEGLVPEVYCRLAGLLQRKTIRSLKAAAGDIARKVGVSWVRKRMSERSGNARLRRDVSWTQSSGASVGPADRCSMKEQVKRVFAQLDLFSEIEKEIILMRLADNESYEGIAARKGKSVVACRSIVSRAAKKMRELLD